jgi:lipopolysaccharide export system protein LptA
MPLPIYRLRRWLIAIALLFILVIAGMYWYARLRERNVLKEVPNKIGIDIKQTASGFQFSKSDGKRTLFTIQAGSLKQFKLNGSAELHNVSIVLYGRDSSRFDQIYGDDFSYDKDSGNVIARGEVQIDLQANPAGQTAPDQSAPKELKNPIHLKTSDLVFNQQSGDAHTNARVDFQTAQASGWAVGVAYKAKTNTLTLVSQVHVTFGETSEKLIATHGVITRDPRLVVLDHPHLARDNGTIEAEQSTFFLGPENEVQRVLATGNVTAQSAGASSDAMLARADQGEMLLTGKQNLLQTAVLTGNVHVERLGSQPMQGNAGKAILDFSGQNELQKIHASDGVHLIQHRDVLSADAVSRNATAKAGASNGPPQNFDITAPIIDFFMAGGNRLDHAITSGAAQIAITPAENSPQTKPQAASQTVVTAKQFEAKFAEAPATEPRQKTATRLSSIHGEPDAKIVNSASGLPDRVSTSQSLDAIFLPEGGIASITQQGNVAYTDNQPPEKRTQAWADKAVYTPADSILVLTGSPRVTDGGLETIAQIIRINRATNDAFADGNVKSTYNDLKEQPNGALLASSSPIHVTAVHMTAHGSSAVALYQGNARLWQDANVITAPSIQFDRDHRSLLAQGTAVQEVSTVLVQEDKDSGKRGHSLSKVAGQTQKAKKEVGGNAAETVAITSSRLTYTDSERRAHYEGGVTAKGSDFTATAKIADAYLVPRAQTTNTQQVTAPSRLDHVVATGNVLIQQPNRKAEGQKLVYTASEDKFVLTGGPPSIFDAERGKITGDSLTFFRADDRVLVEGEASTPVVTQTRVAR